MIEQLLAKVPEGNRIEFGVFRGGTLWKIAAHPGVTVGVDTFTGMPEPGEHDLIDGESPYPKGRLRATLETVQRRVPKARLVQGVVPAILPSIKLRRFGFVHVDLDHYASTLAAMFWSWERMATGGVMAVHDWLPQRNCLASRAIKEFAIELDRQPKQFYQWGWWQRP